MKYTGLHLGCGNHIIEGWLNTDLVPVKDDIEQVDCRSLQAYEGADFDYAFCEHLIEHLAWDDAQRMLRGVRRALKPGGVFRIATPDLGLLVAEVYEDRGEYLSSSEADHVHFYSQGWPVGDCPELQAVVTINRFFREWGHQFLYTEKMLTFTARECGFTKVTRHSVGSSHHAALAGIEGHGAVIGEAINRTESLVLEVYRPLGDSRE